MRSSLTKSKVVSANIIAIIMNTSMIILIAFLIILITTKAITNLEEYVGPHAATDVVLGDSVVDVRPVRVVDDLAWHEQGRSQYIDILRERVRDISAF